MSSPALSGEMDMGKIFGGFKLSVRCRIAFICVLDGWRLDLLSAAYTSNWWPGERNFVV